MVSVCVSWVRVSVCSLGIGEAALCLLPTSPTLVNCISIYICTYIYVCECVCQQQDKTDTQNINKTDLMPSSFTLPSQTHTHIYIQGVQNKFDSFIRENKKSW